MLINFETSFETLNHYHWLCICSPPHSKHNRESADQQSSMKDCRYCQILRFYYIVTKMHFIYLAMIANFVLNKFTYGKYS